MAIDVVGAKPAEPRSTLAVVGPVATLILALATGLPRHSARNLLPHSGEQAGPYLGV